MKSFAYAVLLGSAVAVLPLVILELDSESAVVTVLQWAGKFLMVPGVLLGFLFAGGNVHAIDLRVVGVTNGIVYAGLWYRWMTAWRGDDTSQRRKGF